MFIGSWWGNRREGDHWGDLGVDGWIILGRSCVEMRRELCALYEVANSARRSYTQPQPTTASTTTAETLMRQYRVLFS